MALKMTVGALCATFVADRIYEHTRLARRYIIWEEGFTNIVCKQKLGEWKQQADTLPTTRQMACKLRDRVVKISLTLTPL